MTAPKLPFELTPTEERELPHRVMEILKEHRGSRCAITGAQMAKALGYKNDRAIRVCIEHLIADGVPVAASVHEPFGYYILQTREEAQVYEATLRSRAVKTLKRLKDFNRAAAGCFGPAQQLPLALVEQTIEELER